MESTFKIERVDLENANGMIVRLLSLGATIADISVPEKDGSRTHLALGFDSPEEYAVNPYHLGNTVGRFANRIGGACFSIDGTQYPLNKNEGENHLHGGPGGFSVRNFEISSATGCEAVFSYFSADGEEGYPGNMTFTVTYRLTQDNELQISYKAVCDKDTLANFTNHSYFNLNGGKDKIYEHTLQIFADSYTKTDDYNIPTGEILPVEGTPLDFRVPKKIGRDIAHPSLAKTCGYDNNFCLRGSGLRTAAILTDPASGRSLEVRTDMPGFQIYTAGYFSEKTRGIGGAFYPPHCAIAMEAQNYPDAPNHENFPSAILRAGETLSTNIIFAFTL